MNEQEIHHLVYDIPENVDYTDIPQELDLEDVPKERVDKLRDLLHSDDLAVRFDAALLLTNWGVEDGLNTLIDLFEKGETKGFIPHHLHPYDDTNKHILDALIGYCASQTDLHKEQEARKRIYPTIISIIKQAVHSSYSIAQIGFLIKKDLDIHKEVYTEYIPVLEDFLTAIIDDKERNYWRIHDALKLLLEVDELFVQKILTEKGKTLADFGLDGEEND